MGSGFLQPSEAGYKAEFKDVLRRVFGIGRKDEVPSKQAPAEVDLIKAAY